MEIGKFIGLGILVSSLNLLATTPLFAHGGNATLIHGCVNNLLKVTRIVTPTTNCLSGETAVHWPTEARIVADETRITNTENKNTTQDSAISAIQTKNNQQDTAIAALQGQGGGGGAGGLVVKDSLGQVVGKVLDNGGSQIFVKIGNDALNIFATSNGFQPSISSFSFFYTTNNCSGTRYFGSDRANGSFTEFVHTVDGQTGYYAPLPAQQLFIQLMEINVTEFSGVGNCMSESTGGFTPQPLFVAIPAAVNLNPLGTPPFHLE